MRKENKMESGPEDFRKAINELKDAMYIRFEKQDEFLAKRFKEQDRFIVDSLAKQDKKTAAEIKKVQLAVVSQFEYNLRTTSPHDRDFYGSIIQTETLPSWRLSQMFNRYSKITKTEPAR